MSSLILFNKPYGVLSQFTDAGERPTLAALLDLKGVYPAGRLDRDSEGLLLLTDDGALAHRLTHPGEKTWKIYWVQVEGEPSAQDLQPLRDGVALKDGPALPALVRRIDAPNLWPRDPPVRYRARIPTAWIEVRIREGRNRQVRRMTAAIGFPTLRLVRTRIGRYRLGGLQPGEWSRLALGPPGGSARKGGPKPATKQRPARAGGRRGRYLR